MQKSVISTVCSRLLTLIALTFVGCFLQFTDVQAQTVNLEDGVYGQTKYGYQYAGEVRKSSLTLSFLGGEQDVLFHVRGYDVNSDNELQLLLNGNHIEYLTTTDSLKTKRQFFYLPLSKQVKGQNQLVIKQRTPGERWGVTELGVFQADKGSSMFGQLARLGSTSPHKSAVRVRFPHSMPGFYITAQFYDVDWHREVIIKIDGVETAAAPLTPNNGWGTKIDLEMPAGIRDLEIKNRHNPPRTYVWGVRFSNARPKSGSFSIEPAVTETTPTSSDTSTDSATVDLAYGVYGETKYGYQYDGEVHKSGLTLSFAGGEQDVLFHVRGYDVNDNNELQLLLNGNHIEYLTTTDSLKSKRQFFYLPLSKQVKGKNSLVIKQRTPGERWGVTELGVFQADKGSSMFGQLQRLGSKSPHTAAVRVRFPHSMPGFYITAQFYDVDWHREVLIKTDGVETAAAPVTSNNAWGTKIDLEMPAGIRDLEFKNRHNPPRTYVWGVRFSNVRPKSGSSSNEPAVTETTPTNSGTSTDSANTGSTTTTVTNSSTTNTSSGTQSGSGTSADSGSSTGTDTTTSDTSTPDVQSSQQTTGNWPSSADQSLPMGGIFYGNPYSGSSTGNASMFYYEGSRRFRAERTGYITSVKYNNRTLSDANISGRCNSSPNSVWCTCVNAGLDAKSCGYILSNSYSVGNGGAIVVEVRADDGTDNHFPSDKVLGRVSKPVVPMDIRHLEAPVLEFDNAVPIKAGEIYHIVFKQTNPPRPECQKRALSVDAAAACDRNAGAVSLNGVSFKERGESRGPFIGETGAVLTRNSAGSTWYKSPSVLSWYEIRYDDGMWVGDVQGFSGSGALAGTRSISGSNLVRQKFTVRDTSRSLTGAWLWVSRTSSSTSGNLVASLTSGNGTTLAKVYIPASSVRQCTSTCGNWVYAKFSSAVQVDFGKTYYFVLSAPNAATFKITTGYPLQYGSFQSTNRNFWWDAQAQFSSNGGSNWANFTDNYQKGRDFGLVFTLPGMPKSLP